MAETYTLVHQNPDDTSYTPIHSRTRLRSTLPRYFSTVSAVIARSLYVVIWGLTGKNAARTICRNQVAAAQIRGSGTPLVIRSDHGFGR